jgi:hypothetical protein
VGTGVEGDRNARRKRSTGILSIWPKIIAQAGSDGGRVKIENGGSDGKKDGKEECRDLRKGHLTLYDRGP